MTRRIVVASTFNASHQTSWQHLFCMPWPSQLTKDLGMCLMEQALEWRTGQSTNRGIRSLEGSYIM